MRMGYGLRLEQTQKLIMTPELRQAITILQFSALELSSFVDEQLMENPLLEVVEENASSANSETEKENATQNSEEHNEAENTWDMDWEEYFQRQEERVTREYEPGSSETKRMEPFVATAPTLQEHLLEQLHVQKLSIPVNQVEYIIGNLDDNGYLELPLEEIAREQGIPVASAGKALSIVQSFDPLGVGARNLEECLRLQLPLIPDAPAHMSEFLRHLEDLAAGRLQRIATQMKVSTPEVQALADWVRKLDPKPGRRFSGSSEVRYIVPDVVVEEIEGQFIILVNDITVPRLGINQAYRTALSQNKEDDTRKFVEQKLNSAAWLIRSIEQRRTTLYKVANALVNRQEEFLRRGVRYLRPLTLKDIADEIGVHESTVSRATSNKYVQTPRGIFEFKFFFASGIKNEPGVTTEGIKQALKNLIASENPKAPYSDQKLSELLKEKEMEISRRTVAKYRDELGIPSTALRKRY
ncbi:RNA polymerase factor sigma-54 [Desulfitobacterium metallireducens]|uniref:RNA polymerase sigma-54 subunit RpoN n=1 Tax=Desulfitobacterium metallireducens DSM 15288 TaxID=871968 RepID=W0EFE6_9FIRM|nr:RNA polymerase factor sigma-54 [Desulfitobacterium metallireducens]AHF08218.1 RNA polymerase sigma-54 subunit RpoN [Desulfitobacterium metallireducens DSM 15288]